MKHRFELLSMSHNRLFTDNRHQQQHVRLFSSESRRGAGGGRDDGEDLMAEWEEVDNNKKSSSVLTHVDESGMIGWNAM